MIEFSCYISWCYTIGSPASMKPLQWHLYTAVAAVSLLQRWSLKWNYLNQRLLLSPQPSSPIISVSKPRLWFLPSANKNAIQLQKNPTLLMLSPTTVSKLGLLSLILKSLRKSLMPKAPIGQTPVSDCFRWIALALVVILRCVWPLWDFSFRSYEHFKIIICLETIIVTLRRPYWLSIQDISINEILFCQKSNKKSNPTFPTFSDF